jgi:cytochrome c556
MMRRLVGLSMVIACLCTPVAFTAAQNPSQGGFIPGPQHAIDIIMARRVLMAEIGRNMDSLLGLTEPGGKFDATDAGEHADTIATMLAVFPYLFPPGSYIYSKELEAKDPATMTLAKPEVWQNFEAFFKAAQEAADVALKAAYSKNEAEFRLRYALIQPQCDSCHAAFRQTEAEYVIPIPPK